MKIVDNNRFSRFDFLKLASTFLLFVFLVLVMVIILIVVKNKEEERQFYENGDDSEIKQSQDHYEHQFIKYSKDGKVFFRGSVTTPSYFDPKGLHLSMIQEEEDFTSPEKYNFEVTTDFYCCETDSSKTFYDPVLDNCRLYVRGVKYIVKFYTEEEAWATFRDPLVRYDESGSPCELNEVRLSDATNIVEVNDVYLCHGKCTANRFKEFLHLNPHLATELQDDVAASEQSKEYDTSEKDTLKLMEKRVFNGFREAKKKCIKYRTDGFYYTKSRGEEMSVVKDRFLEEFLSVFCRRTAYLEVRLTEIPRKYYNICQGERIDVECSEINKIKCVDLGEIIASLEEFKPDEF